MRRARFDRARVAAFAALVTSAPCVSAAAETKSEFVWEAPPTCPKPEALRAEFARLVANTKERVQARAVVVTRGEEYHLTLHTRIADVPGVRELSGASCDVLAETALAILGWMVRDAEQARPKKRSSPTPASGTELRPSAGVRLAFDLGSLPGPTLGAGLSAGLAYGKFGVELLVTYWIPRTATAPSEGPEASGEFVLWSIGVLPCWSHFQGALRLSTCALAEGGILRGRGEGDLLQSYTEVAPWWAAGLSAGLLYSPTRALVLTVPRVDLLANLNPRDWVLRARGAEGEALLFSPSEVIFRVTTGVVFQ